MKYEKIQIELLKSVSSFKAHKYNYFTDDIFTYITEGTYIVAIPHSRYFLDNLKVFKKEPMNNSITQMFKEYDSKLNDCLVEITDGNMKLHKFISEKTGEEILVDSKVLSIFLNDKYDDITYYGKGSKNPVIICNNDTILGIVLPVIRR